MLKKYLYFFTVFFLGLNSCLSQNLNLFVRDSNSNNYQLTDETSFNDTSELDVFLIDYIDDNLTKYFITAGFDSIIYDDNIVRAYFTRGKTYKWDEIVIDTAITEIKNIQNSISKNEFVDIEKLHAFYDEVLNYYQNNAYPFASIYFDDFDISDSLFNASIRIDKGDAYYIDTIIVKGDVKISTTFLHNYLGINKNSPFSMKKIDKISQLIKNLSFLDEARAYELAFLENRTDILLYLKEKKANQFNGMIGILPNNQTTGKLMLTGDVNLMLQNSFGKGELISFKWQSFEQNSQNLFMETFYPYIFKSRIGTGVDFLMEKRDTSFLSTDFTWKFRYFTFADNGLDVFYQRVNSFVLGNTSILNDYSDISLNMIGLSLKQVNYDNIFNPRKGYGLSISSALGVKKISTISDEISEKDDLLQSKSSFRASYYFPIGKYISLKVQNQTNLIYSERIYENEMMFIGGLNTIRGFDELSIPTTAYTISGVELRYLFEENSNMFLLYDFAYTIRHNTRNETENFLQGIGAGINLQTNAGVFSIIYAFGKVDNNPIDLKNSKIHIGYKTVF